MSQSSLSVTESLKNLSDDERKEVLKFVEAEAAKSKVQTSIHSFTDLCFKKCNQNTAMNSTLNSDDESCLNNCLNRYLDTNIKVVRALQNQ